MTSSVEAFYDENKDAVHYFIFIVLIVISAVLIIKFIKGKLDGASSGSGDSGTATEQKLNAINSIKVNPAGLTKQVADLHTIADTLYDYLNLNPLESFWGDAHQQLIDYTESLSDLSYDDWQQIKKEFGARASTFKGILNGVPWTNKMTLGEFYLYRLGSDLIVKVEDVLKPNDVI